MKRLREIFRSSPVLRHILTLVSGTVVAQVFALILQVPLMRLYTPQAFGVLAIYASITGIISAIAALRYDMTIMLPEDDLTARVVRNLASRSIIVVAIATGIAGWIAGGWFADYYDAPQLRWWLPIGGLTVFLAAETTTRQYWLNRHQAYKPIAVNRALQTLAIGVFQLLLILLLPTVMGWLRPANPVCAAGTAVPGYLGLIIGGVFGLGFAYGWIVRNTRDLHGPLAPEAPTMWQMANRYRKMPLINGPNTLVDAIRLNGIPLIIAVIATVDSVGQYNRAFLIAHAPAMLIQGAISQVFFQRLAVTKPGEMGPLVAKTLRGLALLSVPTFALFAMVAPWLVPFIFGEAWVEAGWITAALTPWIAAGILASPVSTVFVVTETQQKMLAFGVVYCIVSLSVLFFSPFSFMTTVWLLSATNALMLCIMLVIAWRVVRAYDRRADAASSE
ncbi:MAG: oligosaccharide flippase family protein [Propionibacteriaceae bacterium]|nr:oligosaccharide flippase family protein [Propionibacteriaceae bacterium]